MSGWARRSAIPVALSAIALIAWVLYLIVALSDSAYEWVPNFLRLPSGESGASVLSRRGQFGDAFGAFNALVSTFALIGLLFTLRTQQDQIRSQEKTSASNDRLVRQQQFQDQFFRAVDAYRDQLHAITSVSNNEQQALATGRLALLSIWRNQLVKHIKSGGIEQLRLALEAQREAYENEHSGIWNSHKELIDACNRLVAFLDADLKSQDDVLQRMGAAWQTVYLANRYQLDSLYRAWYTVYRVLDTAGVYQIPPETVRLYSAAFRAQVSWIEMAFLLINQFGLPGNPTYPKACVYSIRYVSFDNLDRDHDLVVGLLSHLICASMVPLSRENKPTLSAEAFGLVSSSVAE